MSTLLLLLLIALIALASIVLPAFTGGAWSPTKRRVLAKMLRYAKLQPDELLIDLGAGDGRVLLAAAKGYGARAVGIEIDPVRYALCRARIRLSRLDRRVAVRKENFFRTDLAGADVVTFYLSQAAADKLAEKFERELRPGTRVVSYRRPLPGWEPALVDEEDQIYVYRVEGATQKERAG